MMKNKEIIKRAAEMPTRIITLCGSSRFIETFAVMAWEFEKGGVITLGLHLLPQAYIERKGHGDIEGHLAEAEGVADFMDALHFKKIEMSDSIFVINIDGYIGESTAREIKYAKSLGKPISYLEALTTKEGGSDEKD